MEKRLVYIAPNAELADCWQDALICYSGNGQNEDYDELVFPW